MSVRPFRQHAPEPGEIRRLRLATRTLFAGMTDQALRLQGHAVLEFLLEYAGELGLRDAGATYASDEMRARDYPAAVRDLLARVRVPQRATRSRLDLRLDWLAATLHLSAVERDMLALFARSGRDRAWQKLLGARNYHAALQVEPIAALCEASVHDVERALMPGAPLLRTELIVDEKDGDYRLGGFTKRLLSLHSADTALLGAYMLPAAAPASVAWEDCDHLPARDTAEAITRAAAAENGGVNILLHGVPGTGKSEFARALAERCGLTAVFAGLSDDDGAEPDRSERLSHLNVLRALTEREPTHLIVVDEADDVLSLTGDGRHHRSKLWLNRLVEEVHTPTIWITNDAHALGNTVIRRMHLAIAFDLPLASVRARVLARAAEKQALALGPHAAARIAQLPAAPAILTNAVTTARLAGGDAATLERATGSILDALGHPPLRLAPLPAAYDPSLAQADQDLAKLAARLAAAPSRGWSLLLAGPPGTGKSAYARHLAQIRGLEVEEKRGSDLLDPFVGGTEANIARAFRDAAERGAMLLIDEADTFLFDRRGATRSWEGCMVNEMLRWMEHHPAPFVATTNLADTLDPATQRRFTLTVRFRALTPARAAALFAATFGAALPAGAPPLEGVTPGDIGAVAKRARVLGESDAATLAAWVRAEVEARWQNGGRGTSRAGFHRPAPEPRLIHEAAE